MSDDALRHTALTPWHTGHGATMAPFAGWWMPLSYRGTLVEHEAVRADVGVFDVSHLGTLVVRGGDAEEVVSRTFTNAPGRLGDGRAQYTLCCDDDGGVVDDLIVYRLSPGRFLAVPNAANTAAVRERLAHAARPLDVEVEDHSQERALLAVQGPRSLEAVGAVLDLDVGGLSYMDVRPVDLEGGSGLVARTGYTGEVGCELLLPGDTAGWIWEALVDDHGVTPAGLGARDTLRLEMGYPLHGQDLTRGTTPYEAGLGWAVALDHGPFTGCAALRLRAEEPAGRRLRGLVGHSRRPPRSGMTVLHADEPVGTVTSGTTSPTRGVGIGLAYLDTRVGPDSDVVVDVRGSAEPFRVVRPPFVDRDPRG